jgi:uncharacterized repeat protein (TIGR03803 family)
LFGGSSGYGTVFKVDTSHNETVLHNFKGFMNSDGAYPILAGLIRDKAGNLYGTTLGGGSFNGGTVFKVDTSGNEYVLYSFSGGTDGANPEGSLVLDKAGNLFGTTTQGGSSGYGTVFKLDTTGKESVLHSFTSVPDGAYPAGAGLVLDKAGNLFGTTTQGGSSNNGTVFKVDTSGNETVLHGFMNSDGARPFAGLIRDKAGSLYGTTFNGGSSGYGTVFKLIP